ncbi:hypothetical protein SAMN07250955_10813 [Arboricoccus pini]|uniref:2,4-dihydroxyhept-2-ene-1,7-dioic acid aldolase n=1 Tax=Arboricoccus pini TaxID=1963835 RepID=A0A212RET1_9PROT|nr:DUF2218 domain-containing protein [Arboricoccus pini]SNB70874.1 hypothetical protein SAMN07250955_10813 [Arboricoccus pini]
MVTSSATVRTLSASRYLQQLCKHWSHRFTVTFDPAKGNIDFGEGQSVELSAKETELVVVVRDNEEVSLAKLETVVADHIKRFAFRETLDFNWSRQT